jgi:hypothetical protein
MKQFDLPIPEVAAGKDPVAELAPAWEAFKASGSLAELVRAIQASAETVNKFASKNVLLGALNPQIKGLTLEQIEVRLDIRAAIKAADKTVAIEDTQYKELIRAIDDMDGHWKAVSADIVATVNAVKAAKKVDLTKAVEAA